MKKIFAFPMLASLLFVLAGAFSVHAATITVTNTNDSGPGSLRAAVAAASPNDMIKFAAATNGMPIVLTSGEITISVYLTITGNGPANTMISGNGMSRIFNINGSPYANIRELALMNGAVMDNGGAVMASGPGKFFLTNCSLTSNTAGMSGGAVYVNGGELTVNGTTISGNTASGAAATQGGGGIYSLGGAVVKVQGNSVISGNFANGASGSGGGIFNGAGSDLSVKDATISNNTASRAGGGVESNSGAGTKISLNNVTLTNNHTGATPGNGGGLHITGMGTTTVTGGMVMGNTAASEGGGLWNGTGLMTVNNVTITGNTASGAAADNGGGGLFNAGGTLRVINGTTITNNVANGASGSGGGILSDLGGNLTVTDCTISGNTASRAGGGVEGNGGAGTMLTLKNVMLMNNHTGATPGNGGGLHLTGAGNSAITGCTVSGNTAASEGGGLWNGTGTMTINGGTTISGNTASGNLADNGGGGVFNAGGTVKIQPNTMITNNMANGTSGSGGGVFNDMGGTLTVTGATISGNTATRAGGGIEDNSGAAGSAVRLKLSNVQLLNNSTGSAPGNGGGLHITGLGNSSIVGCTVTGNTASQEGGGLWNGTGKMTITRTTVVGNSASGNMAHDGGGGLFNNGGTMEVEYSTVAANAATGTSANGGGIHNNLNGTINIEYSTVSGNSSTNMGGGIYNNGTLTGKAITVTANSATNGGGFAQDMAANNASFASSIIAANTAGMSGQDVANVNGTLSSGNYNLIGEDDASVFPAMPGDLEGAVGEPIDPMLSALANNGGATMTHALNCGSPAINAGTPNNNAKDQRSMSVFGGRRDIGSYELQEDCGGDRSANTENSGRTLLADESRVFPNPATDGQVQVLVPESFGSEASIQITDMSGKTLRTVRNAIGTVGLNLSDLSNGTYLVRIEGEGATATHKLVLLR
ncbi:MAG: choice-of-anchor Q domain-containing protein [Saprospiraceae bacterium]